MKKFKTERRLAKITKAAKARQKSLIVILENIHDPHNVSAIYRSCDAVGVLKVGLVYTNEKFPKISRITSSSANKWIETVRFNSVEECITYLKENGFKIYVSILDENAKSINDVDFTIPSAIVMGNEHRGVSDDFIKYADEKIYIPMRGMIQSLNVSVATAVTLYEAHRQRSLKGMYNQNDLSENELENLIQSWCEK
ncbi:MAG: RNA methyltransferase [Melioribacteraceae bacterium]|nr:RNA methyltransferase [Melioribacteraceae bacterium]